MAILSIPLSTSSGTQTRPLRSRGRDAEIQANQFAAALLMPADLVRAAFAKCQDLGELARLFNVSEAAMGFRLDRLGLG